MKKELQIQEFARNTSSVLQRDAATIKADDGDRLVQEEEAEEAFARRAVSTGGPAFFR